MVCGNVSVWFINHNNSNGTGKFSYLLFLSSNKEESNEYNILGLMRDIVRFNCSDYSE